MERHNGNLSSIEHMNPSNEAFKFQLEILRMEITTINEIIGRMDNITQATKNWAIVTWAGGIALALSGKTVLRQYVLLTAILPLLFWYIDAHWRRLQRRSIFRMLKIGEFLNDGRLTTSYDQGKISQFMILDPTGRQYINSSEYHQFISTRQTLRYPEVMYFYISLSAISLILGLLLNYIGQ